MRAPPTDGWTLSRVAVVGLFAIGVAALVIANPPATLFSTVFGSDDARAGPKITTSAGAFGESGEVRLQVRMPGELFDFPIEIDGMDASRSYLWVKAADSSAVVEASPLTGTTVKAPLFAGLFRLAIVTESGRHVVDSIVVAVLVPFSTKLGSTLNGYRIGRYRWERLGGDATPPPVGFLQVLPEDIGLQVSAHVRLGDFLTHDNQDVWPRYIALDPRILDKIASVFTDLGVKDFEMPMDVSSGFRTPLYNRTVRAGGRGQPTSSMATPRTSRSTSTATDESPMPTPSPLRARWSGSNSVIRISWVASASTETTGPLRTFI